jgi:outer membrane protein OmpA-like peptidoglycan-associated protein
LRRAERVRSWLVEHGVAAQRLEVDPEGAVDFVEAGASDDEQQQNRRVLFRVLQTERQ